MSFSKRILVEVEWEDAAWTSGYYDRDYPDKTRTLVCRTVGYILERNRKVIKLCSEHFEDGDARHVQSIPRGMVRKITVK